MVVSSSDLQKHLALVSGVAPAKSVVPIVQNIHFELRGERLYLTASDLENAIQTSLIVEAAPDARFNVALPGKIIQDTLKALPEQPVTFAQQDETFAVVLTTDNGEYHVQGYNGEDFPQLPAPEGTQSIQMPLVLLVKAIEKTLFATSPDDLKPAMTGVFFNFQKDAATFCATDAHRLVRYRRKDINVAEDIHFILPKRALQTVRNTAASSGEDIVTLDYNSTNAFFRMGGALISCRFIEGRFPDYEHVIPKDSPNKIIIDKKDLLSSMRRLDVYSNKTTHLGRFQLEGNNMTVQCEDYELANLGREKLSILYEGEDMEIGFNVSLLFDVIDNVDTEEVVMELDTPGRAAIIRPATNDADEDLLMLAMPVMLTVGY